jgi:periplasmic divalent cation tolerance protein
MTSEPAALIYTTFPSEGEAVSTGEVLVAKRLAACVNIFPPMTAIFEWEGRVEKATETAMIIKTRLALKDDVYTELKHHHSYSIPAFVVLEAAGGSKEFVNWIAGQTKQPG